MSDLVLIVSPVRAGTPAFFLEQSARLVSRLSYPDFDRVVYPNQQEATGGKYWPNAAARNQAVDRFVKPEHEYVLWLDIDIIDLPPNLVELLVEASKRHDGAIVAPMVWMERVNDGPVGLDTGGWFYDTGGFLKDGVFADFHNGVAGDEPEPVMESVGCVYLVPAWLYRNGFQYKPVGNEVEHLSFCRVARDLGVKIVALRGANVIHAYLPKYGEGWHSS